MMFGSVGSNASARASVTAVTMLTQRIWTGVMGMAGSANATPHHHERLGPVGRQDEEDRLLQIVVDGAALLDRPLDGREVVVGQDHLDALLAASVPLIPMAMPMSACFSAGASFTPSPVMATTSPAAWSARTRRSLCSGLARAMTSLSATSLASCSSSQPRRRGR
jgi:hypothetical protein